MSGPGWRDGLTWRMRRRKDGTLIPTNVLDATPGNVELHLAHDDEWAGCLAFDEMQLRPVWRRPPPVLGDGFPTPPAGTPCDELDWVAVQAWYRTKHGVLFPRTACEVGMARAAQRHRFHPVRDYLTALDWDGTRRCDTWLTTYFGATATPYTASVSAATLLGAVARAITPGCKVDSMLILEGPQGVGKSRGLRALMRDPAWFDDHLPDLRDKDAMLHLRPLWLLEVAELDAFKDAENSRIKAFLSKQVDRFRPPYGRAEITAPRGTFFIGTTNSRSSLSDPTGARRFWPVRVGARVDVEGLLHDRDQLWAEGLARHTAGEAWHLSDDAESDAREEQAARFEADAWEEPLRHLLATRCLTDVSTAECLELLAVPVPSLRGKEAKRIARILARLGFEPTRQWGSGRRWTREREPGEDDA